MANGRRQQRRPPKAGKAPGSPPEPRQGRTREVRPPRPEPELGPPPPEPPSLRELREGIDQVDRQLVELLNRRARLVVEVGRVKRQEGVPIYAPHREAQVLQKVLDASTGPLPPRTLEAIYRELMSGSFALEQPLRIAYLGPAGSFSHLAAVRHFGSSVDFVDLPQVQDIFTEVRRQHADYGLVPIENSSTGGMAETLDAFRDSAGELFIYTEVQVEVHHALLSNCPPHHIRRIHSQPEVFQQCRHWLATQYPKAELVPSASSSEAARMAAEEFLTAQRIGAQPVSAAIGTSLAGELYGVRVLFEKIEDHPFNLTRFFVISRQQAERSGEDKTSVMFDTADQPGALARVLQAFEHHGVNLTHIDKRPSGRTNWSYTFFVDAQGRVEDEAVSRALEEARAHCQRLTVLGSYPRSRRIL